METMSARLCGWTDTGMFEGIPQIKRNQVVATLSGDKIRMNLVGEETITIHTTSGPAAWQMLDILTHDLLKRGGSVQMRQAVWEAQNPDPTW